MIHLRELPYGIGRHAGVGVKQAEAAQKLAGVQRRDQVFFSSKDFL